MEVKIEQLLLFELKNIYVAIWLFQDILFEIENSFWMVKNLFCPTLGCIKPKIIALFSFGSQISIYHNYTYTLYSFLILKQTRGYFRSHQRLPKSRKNLHLKNRRNQVLNIFLFKTWNEYEQKATQWMNVREK